MAVDAEYVTRMFGDDLDKETVDLVVKAVNEAPEWAHSQMEHTIYNETRKALAGVVRWPDERSGVIDPVAAAESVAAALTPFVVALAALSGKGGYDRGYSAAMLKMLLDVVTKGVRDQAGDSAEDAEPILRA